MNEKKRKTKKKEVKDNSPIGPENIGIPLIDLPLNSPEAVAAISRYLETQGEIALLELDSSFLLLKILFPSRSLTDSFIKVRVQIWNLQDRIKKYLLDGKDPKADWELLAEIISTRMDMVEAVAKVCNGITKDNPYIRDLIQKQAEEEAREYLTRLPEDGFFKA